MRVHGERSGLRRRPEVKSLAITAGLLALLTVAAFGCDGTNAEIAEMQDQIAAKDATIDRVEQEIEALKGQIAAKDATLGTGPGDSGTQEATPAPRPSVTPVPEVTTLPRPPMLIDRDSQYSAFFYLGKDPDAVIEIELFADKAPITVNNFVYLAENGFYDGVTFHRVIEGFIAQSGDPTGTGIGGPGYVFEDEFHPDLRHDGPGVVSMANSGNPPGGTNGSQFFITYASFPFLDGLDPDGSPKDCQSLSCHSVFGRVVGGMNHVYELTPRDPAADTFQGDVIREVKIVVEERTVLPTCQPTPTSPIGADELRSDKERAAPSTTDVELMDLVSGNSAFAFDLYKALCATDGNLFYSPYSISLALAMTYAGARGETESQMADTLHYLLSQDKLHPAFNALDLELASRGEGAQGKDDKGFRLNIANAIWGQQDYTFLEPFLDVLAESYGAGVRPMDFREAPERSRVTINDWVAERTEDRIKDLIPKGVIDRFTRMVLTNAIYFNAAWQYPFEESSTALRPFHLLDGSSIDVPMMRTAARFGYARGEGYQAVDLPYDGTELSMTILLPDSGHFGQFEESVDAALVSRVLGDVQGKLVALTIPKFEFESQFRLAETLKTMGMPNAFDDKVSDFSGMDGNSCLARDDPCLYIKDVIHKAFISVDEAGTEAAAATAVVMIVPSSAGPPPQPIRVTVDRPFIFLIRDRTTDAILFVGRIEDLE